MRDGWYRDACVDKDGCQRVSTLGNASSHKLLLLAA